MDSEVGYTVEESKNYLPEQVPYIVFESIQARHERNLKRLMLIIALLIILLFGSNIAWLCFYSGFDFESYDADVDAEQGDAYYNYVGDDMEGDVNYGTNKGENPQIYKDGS